MDKNELSVWAKAVREHLDALDVLVNDRKFLKSKLEEHLRLVFNWDDIEYNRDMSVVSLTFNDGHCPSLKSENLKNLGMNFQIRADYDKNMDHIVVIDIYPFGPV